MDAELKKTLKAVTLELRHLLEGRYDSDGKWKPGDLEQRLAAIGVRRDRASVPVDELGHLSDEDRQARRVVDAYLKLRQEAGIERSEAVAEFVRETAYTWANRLMALRCMEARELIDSVILQQEAYGGRSLEHHRLAQRHPELCAGDDDGLFAVLDKVFREQAERLPMLFDPQAPGIALRPAPAALKDCFGLLSLRKKGLGTRGWELGTKGLSDSKTSPQPLASNPFTAPDALGWAYQYWNTEEKDRVFEKVRTVKGAKIAGADIVPATQLYTEDYMVKFLVQNSLGATWMGMHPQSKLAENWEYYVKDADRASVKAKPVAQITFLDPACGSGHFLLEAFDLFYAMYEEEGARGWGLGTREEENDCQQLQRSSGLAEVHGPGQAGLSGHVAVSEGRTLRVDQSDSSSDSVDTVEHRGGSRAGLDKGIPTSPLDRTRLVGGGGNSIDSVAGSSVRSGGAPSSATSADKRGWPDDSRTPEVSGAEGLGARGQRLGKPKTPAEICEAILRNNLFGIDIDPRAVQIAEVSLWMKATERILRETGDILAPSPQPLAPNLVAATASHLKGEAWEEFLAGFEKEPSVSRVLRKFAQTMEHIDEIGSLARPAEDLREIIRQEHATWERQVRERKEANYLFPEIRAEALSAQLPFHEISDDDFGDRLFYRARAGIDAFTERARESGEFEDQLLGSETRTGFRLVDLLSRRYDVVAANPPYMGSKNMGPALKSFVERNFKPGKRDLYAAFILRNLELAGDGGRVAMVTQQSWMFLRSFAELRAVEADKLDQLPSGSHRGILRDATFEMLAHLGENGFDDPSAAGAFVVLFVVAATAPAPDHRLAAFRLIGPKSPQEKDRLLREALGTAVLAGTIN